MATWLPRSRMMNNTRYFLALNRLTDVGPRTVARLLARWPNLQELFELPESQLVSAGVPEKLARAIAQFDWRVIEADLRWQEVEHHALLTWDNTAYPALLKEIHDPPVVLYAHGDLSCFLDPAVAVIGTRKPSVTGGESARHFAFELASRGVTVVSGLALGIDAQAHSGCLDARGKTIAVMGTGVDRIYPYRHRALAEKITQSGLLLSEFPLHTPPMTGHFPRRNRIISGLSLATLVVEAAIKSGSLITARLAMEQNREVFAIPGSIYNPQVRGCHHLLQQGASLATSVDDIFSELQLQRPVVTGVSVPVTDGVREGLMACVGFEATSVDQIVQRSGRSVDNVMCDLTELELQGQIQSVPGGYMRCVDERKPI